MNKITISINGTDITRISCSEMTEIFKNSGYLQTTFKKVDYLGLRNNQFTFKYMNDDNDWADSDEKFFVGYIYIDAKGQADFCGNCDSFATEEQAIEYYNNLK